MLIPEQINIADLPSIPIAERRNLPDISGVYLALSKDNQVLYVGQSKSVRSRWRQHSKEKEIKPFCERIAWIPVEDGQRLEVEKNLINVFKPDFNLDVGRKPSGDEPRHMFNTRLDVKTIQDLDAMAERFENRSAALDGIMDYLKVNNFEREVLPMGQNVPRVAELPPSMGFNTEAVRLLDLLMERFGIESQIEAFNALAAFMREHNMIDGLLEAMAAKNE
jgi:hypothetical protein